MPRYPLLSLILGVLFGMYFALKTEITVALVSVVAFVAVFVATVEPATLDRWYRAVLDYIGIVNVDRGGAAATQLGSARGGTVEQAGPREDGHARRRVRDIEGE